MVPVTSSSQQPVNYKDFWTEVKNPNSELPSHRFFNGGAFTKAFGADAHAAVQKWMQNGITQDLENQTERSKELAEEARKTLANLNIDIDLLMAAESG